EVWGEYKKQTGGSGHFARVKLAFEPNPGKGFEFVDAKKGQAMSDKDAEEVKEGLEEVMLSGLLLDYPLLDMKVTLIEGKRHPVDTKPGDFKNAAILAFRGDGPEERKKRAQDLGVILLEPIMKLEVNNVPENFYGDIIASISSKRGEIKGIELKRGTYLIRAEIPLAETFGYSTTLRSLTEGRANHSLQFSRYEEVPPYVTEELIGKK
ncbi:MAG: translation elongation factor G, partial [Mycoplasmataceae bacterium RV_VA103A]